VYNGTDPDKDQLGDVDQYRPFFFTAISEKVVSNPCESSINFTTGSCPAHLFYIQLKLRLSGFWRDRSRRNDEDCGEYDDIV